MPSARFFEVRDTLRQISYELRKPKGTGNSMVLVPLFDLTFVTRPPQQVQECQIGGTRD